jgi:hypothetical protein
MLKLSCIGSPIIPILACAFIFVAKENINVINANLAILDILNSIRISAILPFKKYLY